ncbi:MAG: phosphotyrosine protein phosphatase [Agathobacter sp.]|nr:phosphotyrosine protein phosphatase [Agathobacter sp.]
MSLKRIIFVAQSGTCREPMAEGIYKDLMVTNPLEVLSRGLVVMFPEPMNQKAEAVLISNGISMEGFTAKPLTNEDITPETMVLTMEESHRQKVLENFENATVDRTYVLTDFVGDELEIMDPHGGALPAYGLCYETLRKSIKKLIKILNEGE